MIRKILTSSVGFFALISLMCVTAPSSAQFGPVPGGGTADKVTVDSSVFTTNLSVADDTVQKALETLDTTAGGSGLPSTAFKDTSTVVWTTSATELWANVPAGVVDALTLAGEVAATYLPSKATIEALLTGQISSHTHSGESITGGTVANDRLPATINATTAVQVGGVDALLVTGTAANSSKLDGYTRAYYEPSKATIESLLTGSIVSHHHNGMPQDTATVTWSTSATELWATVPAGIVDAAKLAGNVAATYLPSKSTIEALLTGTITTHAHNAADVVVDSSGFSGNLSATDDDVQTALATIDGLSIGSGISTSAMKNTTSLTWTTSATEIWGNVQTSYLDPFFVKRGGDIQVGGSYSWTGAHSFDSTLGVTGETTLKGAVRASAEVAVSGDVVKYVGSGSVGQGYHLRHSATGGVFSIYNQTNNDFLAPAINARSTQQTTSIPGLGIYGAPALDSVNYYALALIGVDPDDGNTALESGNLLRISNWTDDKFTMAYDGASVFTSTVAASGFTEGGTALASKYLGITALAADAAKLAGNTYQTYENSKSTIEALLTGTITTHNHDGTNATFATMHATGRSRLQGASDFNAAVNMDSTLGVTGEVTFKNNLNFTKGSQVDVGTTDAFALAFKTNNTVRGIWNSSGNLTIGATDLASTTSKLYVDGAGVGIVSRVNNAGSAARLLLNSSTVGNTAYLTFSGLNSAGAQTDYAYIFEKIIDNTASSASGQLEFQTLNNNTMTTAFVISDSQEIYFPALDATTATAANVVIEGAGAARQLKTVSSLRKYKTDIKTIHTDWDKFMKLNPVSFLEKAKMNGPRIYGFIADEIEKLYKPLAVYHEGKLQSVSYDRVPAINTAAIQDLKRENDELKDRIARLEEIVERMAK